MNYADKIARESLRIGVIKLNPDKPFVWVSGFQMPIYNDNRMFLFYPELRRMISKAFLELVDRMVQLPYILAGTSTAGISPATTLADKIGVPLIYIRDKPKEHGLRNQIEGIDSERDLEGKVIVLIEDLISTGGSSARAVKAIRDADGRCNFCMSIFDYELEEARRTFEEIAPGCEINSILGYEKLLEIARETGYINEQQIRMLREWRADPFGWGEKHGFPKSRKDN